MKKTIIFSVVFLMLATAAYAQLKVSIIQYDPESRFARIQILHKGEKDYHDLNFAIDNEGPEKIVGLIRPKTAIVIGRLVSPGGHTVRLTTLEGEKLTENPRFAKSETLIENEQKAEQEKQAQQEAISKTDEEASQAQAEPPKAAKEEKSLFSPIGIAVFVIALLILLFFAYRYMKKPKKPLPRAMPRPGKLFSKPRLFQRPPPPHASPPYLHSRISNLKQEQKKVYHQMSQLQKEQKSVSHQISRAADVQHDIFSKLKDLQPPKGDVFTRLSELKGEQQSAFQNLGTIEKKQRNVFDSLKSIKREQESAFEQLSRLAKR